MATRKPGSKLKLKTAKSKAVKAAPKKNAASAVNEVASSAPMAKGIGTTSAAPVKEEIKSKHKVKLVRDSFAMPKNEYLVLSDLKLRSARLGMPSKKSEILRAGVSVLSKMSDTFFSAALEAIPSLKTGRPKDAKKAGTKKTAKKS